MNTVQLTVHFGNSNWFRIIVPETLKFGKLYELCASIINIELTDLLYIICDGYVIGAKSGKYSLDSSFANLDTLDVRDHELNIYVVIKNPTTKADKFDELINNRVHKWLTSNIYTSTTTTTTTTRNTRITRNSNNLVSNMTADIFQGLFSGGQSGGSTNVLNTGNMTYEQALGLGNVPVVLTEAQFDSLTVEVAAGSLTAEQKERDCFCGTNITEEIEEAEHQGITKLPCNHFYHTHCIKQHLTTVNTKCPVCNHDVRETS